MEKVIAVVGPTACGKTSLSLRLAEELGGEIVSADSMQVYRGMDIGTAKATREERERIPHHLIDIAEPDVSYTAGQYQKDAFGALEDILGRGKTPVLCGGSGLYVNAVTHDLDFSRPSDPERRRRLGELRPEEAYARLREADPESAARIHPHNVKRVLRALEIAERDPGRAYDFERRSDAWDFILIGISPDRTALRRAIDERADRMMELGLVEEVSRLVERYGTEQNSFRQAIGYKEIVSYLRGETRTLDAAVEEIKANTRRFAKRQRTWFARDPRIHWFESPDDPGVEALIAERSKG